ncbi:glycosyltransferase family 4 protein [Bradyrhizobium sp. McL0616]|uniref:glycosyltransferase family 4 protein n=1 Tax=Bradyrhizobium sp. McL0616 TaxID=3415674 RepID=UPI003CE8DE5B
MRVAYFTNQYPSVSHTFIRREIRAVEALGITVQRYALRPGEKLVDLDDKGEFEQTRYILGAGFSEILRCCVIMVATRPLAVARAILLAIKIGWRSDRGILRSLAYVSEAAVLARWCCREAVEHLHAHFGTNSAAIAMLAWRLSGIPYSFTVHGPDEFERATLLSLGVKLQNAAFAVCVSSYGRSQLMRWCHPDLWPKIAIVHCGLDSAFLDGPVESSPSTRRLVCVGRLSEQKAQLLLVAAARRLRGEGIDCEIVLAGDGPMRNEIEDAIRDAGLESKITITGWISGDQVKAEIVAATALVLPSFAENMPVVIMEAFALGRPVISTYVAGIPELVRPGTSGWLVPAGDEVLLAEAIREALGAPIEQLVTMGAAGRHHVLEQHDVRKEAAKLKSLFETRASTKSKLM